MIPGSISKYMQHLGARPVMHMVWTFPFGISYEEAMRRAENDRCICGKPRRNSHWLCSPECNNIWWEQFEFWFQLRNRVAKDHQACQTCGRALFRTHMYAGVPVQYEEKHVDHIVPIMDGGPPWDPGNLQVLCGGCHAEKTATEATARSHARRRARNGTGLEAFQTS